MKPIPIISLFVVLTTLSGQKKDNDHILLLKGHAAQVNTVEFTSDNAFLFTGSDDRYIKKWDIQTGALVTETQAHFGPVRQVLAMRDGIFIMSAGDKVIKTWDIDLAPQDKVLTHNTYVWSFDITGDKNYLVSGTYEKRFYLWNMAKPEIKTRPDAHEKTVLSVAYSVDGRYFATGSLDASIFIWNAVNLETEKAGIGHADNIYDLEFTPDGKYLVSVSKDKTVKVWDTETGGHHKTMIGHTDAVMSVSIHPNSIFCITGSLDGTIRLWNLVTGDNLYTYTDHRAAVHAVRFSPDGRYFASGSSDNTAILWKMSPRVVALFYHIDEIEDELQGPLFGPRLKGESKVDYEARQQKAKEKEDEVFLKFYNQFINNLNH